VAEPRPTLVMPFPVEMLRFFDQMTRTAAGAAEPAVSPPAAVDKPNGQRPEPAKAN
jgi:hypothetical protein